MGRMKFRQGMSIDLGLKINRPKIKEKPISLGQIIERQKNWFMATVQSFIKPFVQIKHKFQQYRRKV